ncbi:MAG TPA: hypothetical protein PK988_12880, partial [Candidatus Sumerlaeota bacterium]|nr:hypothetical protein [Candidatus Sumerlaeota bacterium]
PGTGVWNYAKAKGLVNDNFEWSRLGVTYDTFSWDVFPFMGENIDRETFWNFWTKFHHLAKEINYVGQIRGIAYQNGQKEQKLRALEHELKTLQGSRLVKIATKLRDIKQGLLGKPVEV